MFFLRYTDFTGRHDFSLGSFPFTTLAQARRKALETWVLIKNGQSPIELRKREKQERMKALQEEQRNRALLTFKIVAEEWIADRVKHNYWAKNPGGEKTTRGVLQKHVYFALDKKVAEGYRQALIWSKTGVDNTNITVNGRGIQELYDSLKKNREHDKLAVVEKFMLEQSLAGLREQTPEIESHLVNRF